MNKRIQKKKALQAFKAACRTRSMMLHDEIQISVQDRAVARTLTEKVLRLWKLPAPGQGMVFIPGEIEGSKFTPWIEDDLVR